MGGSCGERDRKRAWGFGPLQTSSQGGVQSGPRGRTPGVEAGHTVCWHCSWVHIFPVRAFEEVLRVVSG